MRNRQHAALSSAAILSFLLRSRTPLPFRVCWPWRKGMKKRWRSSLLWFEVLGVLSLAGLAVLPPRHGITPENFARLREGMTQQEVEALLGVPPGSYSTGA